jgi:hypothetical protein
LKLPNVSLNNLTPDLPACHQQASQAEAPNERNPDFNYHRPIGDIFNLSNPDKNQQTQQPVPLPTCKPSSSSCLITSQLPLPSEPPVSAPSLSLPSSKLSPIMSSAPLCAKFSLFPIQENVDSEPRPYEEPDEEHQVSEEHQSEQEHLSSRHQSPTSEQESLPLRHQSLNPEQEHLSLSPVPEHKQLGSEPQPDNESDQDYRSEQEVQSTTIEPEHPWDNKSHELPQSTNSDKAHPRNYSAKDHPSSHLILDPDQGDQGNEDEDEYYLSEEEDQSCEDNLGMSLTVNLVMRASTNQVGLQKLLLTKSATTVDRTRKQTSCLMLIKQNKDPL